MDDDDEDDDDESLEEDMDDDDDEDNDGRVFSIYFKVSLLRSVDCKIVKNHIFTLYDFWYLSPLCYDMTIKNMKI
jgi:hypothetical protein